jgi:hypothetical protein
MLAEVTWVWGKEGGEDRWFRNGHDFGMFSAKPLLCMSLAGGFFGASGREWRRSLGPKLARVTAMEQGAASYSQPFKKHLLAAISTEHGQAAALARLDLGL